MGEVHGTGEDGARADIANTGLTRFSNWRPSATMVRNPGPGTCSQCSMALDLHKELICPCQRCGMPYSRHKPGHCPRCPKCDQLGAEHVECPPKWTAEVVAIEPNYRPDLLGEGGDDRW